MRNYISCFFLFPTRRYSNCRFIRKRQHFYEMIRMSNYSREIILINDRLILLFISFLCNSNGASTITGRALRCCTRRSFQCSRQDIFQLHQTEISINLISSLLLYFVITTRSFFYQSLELLDISLQNESFSVVDNLLLLIARGVIEESRRKQHKYRKK
jgi:hypothetical protein